ncbi:hypothetical protein GGD46_006469 [Rhizobium lusitanum]|uniref:Uncharacterized protein n=1 Tax=Rhizobium lusitanum TaxID=293958 RepID=A0A7X0MHH6_9HYPH|nr:hypothetical protein [Rhizobium lusitanum]
MKMVVDGIGHAGLIGGGCFAEHTIAGFQNRRPAARTATTKPHSNQTMGEMI